MGRLSFYEELGGKFERDRLLQNRLNWFSWHERSKKLKQEVQDLKAIIYDRVIQYLGHVSGEKADEIYKNFFDNLKYLNASNILPIFTTNYDLTFEDLCKSTRGFKIINGLRERVNEFIWDPTVYQGDHRNQVLIFRLHGCSHWFRTPGGEIFFHPKPSRGDPAFKEVVLYPGDIKVISEEPFATAYDYLDRYLAKACICIVIGYSFRDVAIETRLRTASMTNADLKFIVVDPNKKLGIPNRLACERIIDSIGESATRQKVVERAKLMLKSAS